MEPVEWQAAIGGQIDGDSHGDANVALRTGTWTFALRTDAPEITWAPATDRGRGWVQARGHAFAAQMFISPWTAGAPDPTRALSAASAGLEAGWVGYGPAGTYLGGRASLDGFFPYARDGGAPPGGARAVGTIDALLGWWTPALHAWARAGVDLATRDGATAPRADDAIRAPHLHGELTWLPDTRLGTLALAPRVELRAGIAADQDALLYTRVGGLNPWVVPLAGAAWAEWWVEDYAAARLGGTVGVGEVGPGALGLRVSPFVDLAAFDNPFPGDDAALGLGLGVRAWRGHLFLDATGGYAPTLPRAAGYGRASVWLSLGWDWGTATGPSDTSPPGPPGVAWPGNGQG